MDRRFLQNLDRVQGRLRELEAMLDRELARLSQELAGLREAWAALPRRCGFGSADEFLDAMREMARSRRSSRRARPQGPTEPRGAIRRAQQRNDLRTFTHLSLAERAACLEDAAAGMGSVALLEKYRLKLAAVYMVKRKARSAGPAPAEATPTEA